MFACIRTPLHALHYACCCVACSRRRWWWFVGWQRKFLSLIVGNALYDGVSYSRLHESERDVRELYDVIVTQGGVESVTKGPVVNASRAVMEHAFRHLVSCVKDGDTVFVHITCHGVSTRNGLYFIPVDASTWGGWVANWHVAPSTGSV
jgi:hypothetical protein